MAIKSIEWLGFYEAEKVTAKSEWMRDEIERIYKVPDAKIQLVSPAASSWVKDILRLYEATVRGAKPA
jgi:hypothetical protein